MCQWNMFVSRLTSMVALTVIANPQSQIDGYVGGVIRQNYSVSRLCSALNNIHTFYHAQGISQEVMKKERMIG